MRHYKRTTLINFKLKSIDKIFPVGQQPNLYLSWFWLTDGDLWLKFGEQTIYEYSKEALEYFGDKPTAYSDYPIVRFLEDFTKLFKKVSESIPDKFYYLTRNIPQFEEDAQKWLDIYDTDENEYSEFYFEEYYKLISWKSERLFDSLHLIGGPHVSFFRCKDNVRINWDVEYTLENGVSLWTAKNGSFEMNYHNFIDKVKEFGVAFFIEMDKQIEETVAKEWGEIKVDKIRLVEEQQERKRDFYQNLNYLEHGTTEQTNWTEVETLFDRMTSELK